MEQFDESLVFEATKQATILQVDTVIFVDNLTYISLIANYTGMSVIGKIQNLPMDA